MKYLESISVLLCNLTHSSYITTHSLHLPPFFFAFSVCYSLSWLHHYPYNVITRIAHKPNGNYSVSGKFRHSTNKILICLVACPQTWQNITWTKLPSFLFVFSPRRCKKQPVQESSLPLPPFLTQIKEFDVNIPVPKTSNTIIIKKRSPHFHHRCQCCPSLSSCCVPYLHT